METVTKDLEQAILELHAAQLAAQLAQEKYRKASENYANQVLAKNAENKDK